jgi:hypothetical protein
MKKPFLLITALTLGSISFAQSRGAASANPQKEAAAALAQKSAAAAKLASPFATSTCSFTFTSGTGNNFLQYCVTVNGNIAQFQTPSGVEHIAVGTFGEGYGFCDFNSLTAYDDYADFGDSGNWQAARVASSSPTFVKIVRTTSDGIWTLTQTISQVSATGSAKVTMTLKNNTAVERTVELLRYADVDADSTFQNNFDATVNSAFGWNSTGTSSAFGMTLQDVSTTAFSHTGFAQIVPFGPDPCNPLASFVAGTQVSVDGSIAMLYAIDIPANSTRTVSVSYKGM